ncbi:hypothetical protein TcWFU_006568 [Taenia crassiceps]|uniref:Uncharacterized protein n=1 Tax=Taenia crassiceps TaxID=6207 RepID=A0ABR4QB21_9CEST
MDYERERLLAFQTWDSWISDLLSITASGYSPREHSAPPPIQPPQFPEGRNSRSKKITSQSTSKPHSNSIQRNKWLFKALQVKSGRSRTPSRVAKRTRPSSRSRSRKRRSKMLLAIHRITRDLEADMASSLEWNNCHASDADSDTDSTIFLRISELRSETDETLPRLHVSPPIPPHKLEKKPTSQALWTGPKVTKAESTHEDMEEKERANRQNEVGKTENLMNEEPSQVAKEENGEGKKGEEKAWREDEEEGELELKESTKPCALFPSTTELSTLKEEEVVGSELQLTGRCGRVTELGAEDYSIRQNESGHTSSRETMNYSGRSEECDLSGQALPLLVRRWAYQASLEKSGRFFDSLVDERSSLQESQNTLEFGENEAFIQFSETEYGPSETQSECKAVRKKCAAERSLSELSKYATRRRPKKVNAKRLRKRIKHLHVPQNSPECLQEQRDKRKSRHKSKRHLGTGGRMDEDIVAEEKNCRRRVKRSRGRRRKQCKSKDGQQYRKGINSQRMVSEFGDEGEAVPVTLGRDVAIWKCKSVPKRVKKHKCASPTNLKNSEIEPKRLISNMFRAVQEAVTPIKCKNLTSGVSKKVIPSPRHRRERVKRPPHGHSKHGLDRNNNAVNGKGDVNSKTAIMSETTQHISPLVVPRGGGCEPPCSHRGIPRLGRSIIASNSMGDAADSSWYPTPGTKFSESPESLRSFYSYLELSTRSPCVIQRHQTSKSVKSVPGKCNAQKTQKVMYSKSHKLKRRGLLRCSPSFKERLKSYNKKGQPHEVENLLSIITDKYGLDLREYVQYLQVLRDSNNANRQWCLSTGQNKWGQWTQEEAKEFEEFLCFISIDTADIDDTVLPFRVSIMRHKLIARAFKLYRESLQKSKRTPDSFVYHNDNLMNAPFASFLWLKMCQLPSDHPIRCMLRSSSGPQDRRIFAIENDIDGRILLSENEVVFVRGLPCFQIHIVAPTTMAIRFALMQMEQRLPSLYAKLVITERLPMVHSKWGDRSVQAPTMGNFTTHFNHSPHLAPRITVTHAPLSAAPEDRRNFASHRVNEDDPELEQIKMSQKFVDQLCTY